ncbi:OpgC domain-containing protein [Rhodopseudomonas palustris]
MRCGKHSLVIYCAGVRLSFAAHAVLNLGWNSLGAQTLVSLAGLGAMSAIASLLAATERAAAGHPRPL